jgi:hypothetical protein
MLGAGGGKISKKRLLAGLKRWRHAARPHRGVALLVMLLLLIVLHWRSRRTVR